ncbi:MAG: hypothetical protein P1U81_20085, partial [Verrucomicrobiales bacterium]|nr:hypothetical protein [Verrucomicrobiales bacterium]
MKTLITTFALGFITCAMPAMADVPGNQKKTGTLTVQQAASMVREHAQSKTNYLFVNWLTSIDRDVARELAKHGGNINGDYLTLDGLTSIDKAVAR